MRPSEDLPDWIIDGIADTVLSQAPVPMALLNLQLRHVLLNPAIGRLYGVDPQAAVGATPVELLGDLGEQIAARCRAVVDRGRAELGHVVTGALTGVPQGEVHWQLDCLPLENGTSIGALMLIVTDITTRTRAMRTLNEQRRALAYQASHDPVTGLANRYQLFEVLQYHLSTQSRPSVLLVDLDGFKGVNDVHGHAAGDHVLATVATRLKDAAGPEDLVTRFGGDEFVLIVSPSGDAGAVVDRIEAVLEDPIVWAGNQLVVGASVGVAVGEPDDTVSAILHRADEEMYAVKAARKGGR